MTTDLTMLVYALILAFVQLCLYATPGLIQLGIPYAAGPRDEPREMTGVVGRLRRAYFNHIETLPIFAAAVIIAHIIGKADHLTALYAQVYFWSRVAYVPAYASGIPYLRSAIWIVAACAIVGILYCLLF